jgi:eukaryotic-like serine/threonine-protein kinase
MSPEQARGKLIDKRTDIWAFGCVLYEMLIGRQAFQGETVSDTIAAILEREPVWSALSTGATVRQLLHRCLDKDPQRRLRDIEDAKFEIDAALNGSAGSRCRPVPRRLRGDARGFLLSRWELAASLPG